jgi:hypothetical protein
LPKPASSYARAARDTAETNPNDSASGFLNHGFGDTLLHHSRQYQIHFMRQHFGASARVVDLAGHMKFPYLLQKFAPEFWREKRRTGVSVEEKRKTMRARPEVRDILIAHKLRYWSLRAQYPTAFPNCSAARARRNTLRLLAKYPQIGKRLSMTVLSAYPPL